MRMMMLRIGQIQQRPAVEEAVLAMAMKMTTARVSKTRRAVRKGPEQRTEQRMGRGKGRGKERDRGRQWRKGW